MEKPAKLWCAKLSTSELAMKCLQLRNQSLQWQKWKAVIFGTECWGYWQVDEENTYLATFWASASKQRWLRMAFEIKVKVLPITSSNVWGLVLMVFSHRQEWKLSQIKISGLSTCWEGQGSNSLAEPEIKQWLFAVPRVGCCFHLKMSWPQQHEFFSQCSQWKGVFSSKDILWEI